MKKILFFASALAGLFFAASCQQENLEPVVEANTVTYTVQVPGAISTKAIGDEITGDYTLYYEVYRAAEVSNPEKGPAYEGSKAVESNGTVTVDLEFVKDQSFVVLFWAQNPALKMFNKDDLRKVQLVAPGLSNNEYAAVFAGSDKVNNCISAAKNNITLVRPVSQLNIATNDDSQNYGSVGITLSTSTVTVSGLSKVYNVATQEVETVTEFTYEDAQVPTGQTLTVAGEEYTYAAMNYIGFAPQAGTTVDVTFTVTTSEGPVEHSVPNVPVKPNYRTNIVGNLLTETSDFNVSLDKEWEDVNGGNIEFINDGLVKNLDGAYEVSNAKGLAYAINNLFVEGGDFYLTAATYDLSAFNVVAPSIPANVTLNLYGETPVVTRATVSVAGVTITGLPGALLDKVEGNVSISGINLPDTGSAFVNNNEGTVVVSESSADEVVLNGNAPVEADNVKDLATLKAALASDVKVIELASDIEANEVIYVGRSVVINGNDYTLETSANRAFRINASDVDVHINNLNILSSAAVNYPSDVRGISLDPEVNNASLILDECTIDFTDVTTCDWTYAVNVTGGKKNTVVINGGYYEGANVINVRGEEQSITIDGANLTSMYPAHETYYGACVYVLWYSQTEITLMNSELHGNNAVAINGCEEGKGNILVANNNEVNVMRNNIVNGINTYYVTSVEKLNQAVAAAKTGDNQIYFSADLTGNVTVVQKPGVKITIDGNGQKYNGSIKVHSNSEHYADAALTIKNVNFETSVAGINVIEALENGAERYSTNLTVENCTFTATGEAVNTSVGVQIKSSKNAKVINCTATDMHSLIQAQSCDETVVVTGCTVNGKNGVAFKQVKAATVEGTTITALEYGIRFDGNTDNYGITVKDNAVTAVQPLIVRKMTGKDNTIALEGANTFNTEAAYQIVLTNASDDEAYVVPTGTYTLTGADNAIVYPRDFAVSTVEDLKAASKKSGKIYIVNDITVSSNWSYRTDAEFANPVVIDGMGHTIKFVGQVSNPNNNNAFRFENEAVVKNLTIDLSETPSTKVRAISTKSAITVDNCVFIGNEDARRGIIFGEGASNLGFNVTVTNSRFENWGRGLTDNENAKDIKAVAVDNNTFTNASVYLSAYESVVFTGNVMNNSLVNITSYTSAANVVVTASGNTLDTSLYNNIGSASRMFTAANVEAQEGFTVYAQ